MNWNRKKIEAYARVVGAARHLLDRDDFWQREREWALPGEYDDLTDALDHFDLVHRDADLAAARASRKGKR